MHNFFGVSGFFLIQKVGLLVDVFAACFWINPLELCNTCCITQCDAQITPSDNPTLDHSPKTRSSLTVTFCMRLDSMTAGLSGYDITSMNYLSKQDSFSFHKLVLSNTLMALPAPGRSHHLLCAICRGTVNSVPVVLYAARATLFLTYFNGLKISKVA
jgi:hypothetical protein